ncbi:Uncharacterized protein PCOAH_00014110 [Plasmodium coatneyi]|uniref:Uncharacterized protein n=1 Tax=Plasmodium coatneyi TaxID=208452 RepID=A0A1B1DWZ9_9APIC|nr:Uncharacterized protein PCOAH_00014110 [Plasmodium coatneyi]ANQ07159.1 Uncharacterized protein PCOAH_00014110 [Plasmodium coatneyi]
MKPIERLFTAPTMSCCGIRRGQEYLLSLNRRVGRNNGMSRMARLLLSSLGGKPPAGGGTTRTEEPAPKLGNVHNASRDSAKQHPRVDPPVSLPSNQTDDDAVTKEIYDKILQEHKLLRGRRTSNNNRKKKNCEIVPSGRSSTSVDVHTSRISEMTKEKVLSLVRSQSGGKIQMDAKKGEVEKGKDVPAGKKPDGLTIPRKDNHLTVAQKKADTSVECTEEKNIHNMLHLSKRNNISITEKKKNDHFFKIFFSSKKVKIIKSQNHPIFIHLYKLATDAKYREKQEKILLSCKKMILEREQNHIARIYTNSIDNLRDFRCFDNFILLSNRLLKRVAFLYSFKNGVLAEVAHTFQYDDVGLPRLALCFCDVNCGGGGTEKGEEAHHSYGGDHANMETNLFNRTTPVGVSTERLCNGDIGTLIRSCFLLKWQCVFNVQGLGHMNKGKTKESKVPSRGNTDWQKVTNTRGTTRKKPHINDIYNIDFFHPLTLRASAGHLLDIPYKKISFTELHKYARENKILLLKYRIGGSEQRNGDPKEDNICYNADDLYIHYNGNPSEQVKPFLNLLAKAKGVFLLLDNCNNIEREYPVMHRNYVDIGLNIPHSSDDRTFDRVYYVNLLNNKDKPLDVVAAYSILMYILKTNFFRHVPQSCYVCAE